MISYKGLSPKRISKELDMLLDKWEQYRAADHSLMYNLPIRPREDEMKLIGEHFTSMVVYGGSVPGPDKSKVNTYIRLMMK